MAPYIDLINHRQGAGKPRPLLVPVDSAAQQQRDEYGSGSDHSHTAGGQGAQEAEAEAEEEVMVVVTSMLHGQLAPLAAGEELCVSYVASCQPLMAFMNFGFVPPELVM